VCACGCIIACEKHKGRGIKELDLVQEAWRIYTETHGSTLNVGDFECGVKKIIFLRNTVDVWTVTFIYK